MKRLLTPVLILFLLIPLPALGKTDADNTPPGRIRVACLSGPSGLGMSQLFLHPPILNGQRVSIEVLPSVDVMYPKLLNGDIDIGILPPNVAAKLRNNKPSSIVAGAVVGNGMLSIVSGNSSISSLLELRGSTVFATGQGSTPEYILRTLISRQGLSENDITLDFSLSPAELAAAVASSKVEYALLPEPFATVAIGKGSKAERPVRKVIDIAGEWGRAGLGADYPMTVCVIRQDLARRDPEAVHAFLDTYRSSINWTIANPDPASIESSKAGVGLSPELASQAIPSCKLVFIPAHEARASIEGLLRVFLAYSPESIGGKLPDDGFYLK